MRNNPDRKVASSVDVVNDEGRLVAASSADTSNPQFKGDNSFNRDCGNYRGRGYGRGNNRGQGRGVGKKFDNATVGGHQFNFCKVKGQNGSIDGVESVYQGKLDDYQTYPIFSVGVVTRAQAKQEEKAYKKLKVPDQILRENKQAFQDAQMSDFKS